MKSRIQIMFEGIIVICCANYYYYAVCINYNVMKNDSGDGFIPLKKSKLMTVTIVYFYSSLKVRGATH